MPRATGLEAINGYSQMAAAGDEALLREAAHETEADWDVPVHGKSLVRERHGQRTGSDLTARALAQV